jgi:2',3'-cyclic-nucleotide 2'-phosphodiesterase (5'-nucleotidase family)
MKNFKLDLSKMKMTVILTLIFVLLGSVMAYADTGQTGAELVLLSTTDLHGYVFPVNYFNGKDLRGTLSRAATLIKNQRQNHENVMLFDVGDTIQGSQLVYYWGVVNPSHSRNLEHVMAKAMNYLGYDAMVLGNHEFQIGRDNLLSFVKDADFPVLSANTVFTGTNDLVFEPYALIEKELNDGEKLNVGVIGLTTPRWVQWYGGMVGYEFDSTGMYEAAEKFVPEMKDKGADIIVALIHGGLSDEETKEVTAGEDLLPEHDVLRIARQIPDLDVILYGHTHKVNTQKVANEISGREVLISTRQMAW